MAATRPSSQRAVVSSPAEHSTPTSGDAVPEQPRRPKPVGCPALGLAGDRATYFLTPMEVHRCFAEGEGRVIPVDYQERFCLSGRHTDCPVWQGRSQLTAEGPRARRRSLGRAGLLAGGMALVASLSLLVGAAVVAPALRHTTTHSAAQTAASGDLPASAAGVATAAQTAAPPQTPAPDLLPALRAIAGSLTGALSAPVPVPVPTSLASQETAGADARSAPTAPAVVHTYTVQKGDTLTALARHFGTTAAALARANGLSSTARLRAGQVLQLPAASH